MGNDTNQLIKNRHIRLFISSTFEDMQDERNYLMRRTFPKLQLLAAQRDVMLTAIDLRWGITKEEAENGNVVDMCFQEIENSIPFFIGIIGNRYGWCPTPEEINSDTTLRFPQIKNLTGLSMTEMEIQFAVLKRRRKMHAYFFIKKNEFEPMYVEEQKEKDKVAKLALLKETIQNNKRYHPLTYSNVEELASKITDAFNSLLDELFKEKSLSSISKEVTRQRAYRNQLCHTYVKDVHNFDFLNDWLNNKHQRQLVVIGESGIGKTALLANWISELESAKSCNYNVVYHFIGNGGCEGNHEHIQNLIYEEITNVLGESSKTNDTNNNEGVLGRAFTLVAKRQDIRLLLVLDGINQLAEDDAKSLVWIPIPPNNMKIVFSTLENDKTMLFFKNRGKREYPIFVVEPIKDIKIKQDIIKQYLGNFAKKLSKSQVERIISDSQCNNTLVLISLLNVLINFCTHDNLDETIDYFLHSDTIDDYYKALIDKYEKEFDKHQQTKGLVRYALSLVFVSRTGISENDLINITKVSPYHWSQFFFAFLRNFSISNGYISFSHQYLFNAVKKLYLSESSWERKCRRALISCVKKRNDAHSWNEVPFQYYCLKDHKRLFAYLCNIKVFEYLYYNDILNLIKYWRTLNQYEDYSFRNYIVIMEKDCAHIDFDKLILLFDFANYELNLNKVSIIIAELAKNYASTLKEKYLLYKKLDVAYSNCGLFREALQYSKLHLDLSIKIFGYRSTETISAFSNLAKSYGNLQDNKNEIYPFLNAVRIVKALFGTNSDRLVSLYDNISSVFDEFQYYGLSSEYYDAARKIEQQVTTIYISKYRFYDVFDLDAANSFGKIASYYSGLLKNDKAIQFYKKQLKILQNVYGRYHKSIARVHKKLAEQYELVHKDKKKSFKECLNAANIIKHLYGQKDIEYVNCLIKAGRYAEGLDIIKKYGEALNISIELFGEDDRLSLDIYFEIALYYEKNGDYHTAIQYYDKIISLYKPSSFPTSYFYQQIITSRLICINKVYIHSIVSTVLSAIKNMPSYVFNYRQSIGGEYFRRIIKCKSSNKDIYVSNIYLDWILLQKSQSHLSDKNQEYEFNIGIEFDHIRWDAARISKSSHSYKAGTYDDIQRYINSKSDNTIMTFVIRNFEDSIEKFFKGCL